MNNKLKLSLIATTMAITSNTNAQTFYSCIPQGCPSGQYFDGKKCLSVEHLISDQMCPPGYIVVNMKCCKNEKKYINVVVAHEQTTPVVSNKGVKPTNVTKTAVQDIYGFYLFPDDYVDYLYINGGPLKHMRTYGDCQEVPNNLFEIKE